MTLTVFAAPSTVSAALAQLAETPDWLVVAGGTDVVPALRAGRLEAPGVLSLTRLREIGTWSRQDGAVRIGAGLTCSRARELAPLLPALADAASAIGSPGVRNAATVGGNLVSAAGGDLLGVLIAADAVVELAAPLGIREVSVADFLAPAAGLDQGLRGPGRPDLRRGELVTAVRVPLVRGASAFARVALRRAAAPALLTLALVLDVDRGALRVALGVGRDVPARVQAAEDAVAAHLAAEPGAAPSDAAPPRHVAAEFGRAVGSAAGPDPYTRHAAGVCASRLLARAFGGTFSGGAA